MIYLNNDIVKKIDEYCEKNGLALAIGSAEKLNNEQLYDFFDREIPFVKCEVDERFTPTCVMEDATSIIMIGVKCTSYKKTGRIGEVAKDSYFDYHEKVTNHLNNIVDVLKSSNSQINYKLVCDGDKLNERLFGSFYGLGFVGRNNFLINDKLGCDFNIGMILCDEALTPTKKINKECFMCLRCVEVCPTKALDKEVVDTKKCISSLSQQKGLFTIEEIKSLGNSLYGCDKCKYVCPHNPKGEKTNKNKNKIKKLEQTTIQKSEEAELDALTVLGMTKSEFKQFDNLAFYWRGLPIIKRNAIYAIYNSNLEFDYKLNLFKKQLEVETLELPKKALEQVIEFMVN